MADKISKKDMWRDMHQNPMDEKTTYKFSRRNPGDKIWRVIEVMEDGERVLGQLLVSFDKKKIHNVYADYPDKMTKEEQKLFEKEYPDWVEMLSGKK